MSRAYHSFPSFTPSSIKRKVFYFMGEAILVKTINGTSYATGGGTATEGILTVNGIYTCTKSGMYQITCVGGGGGGGYGYTQNPWSVASAGGSGFMNSTSAYLYKDQDYIVTIGGGGYAGNIKSYSARCGGDGQPTSFSDIVYAAGGTRGHSVSGWCDTGVSSGARCNNLPAPGQGFNNGTPGLSDANYSAANAAGLGSNGKITTGGWLYYHGTSVSNVQNAGMERLYYGDGGSTKCYYDSANSGNGTAGNGNSGCIIIKFLG